MTTAAVHGAAAGLGLSLALSCDHVLVEKEAKLAMNFIGIGLVPDGGGHFFLERRIGETAAKELIWSGKKLTGAEAHEPSDRRRRIQRGLRPFCAHLS